MPRPRAFSDASMPRAEAGWAGLHCTSSPVLQFYAHVGRWFLTPGGHRRLLPLGFLGSHGR